MYDLNERRSDKAQPCEMSRDDERPSEQQKGISQTPVSSLRLSRKTRARWLKPLFVGILLCLILSGVVGCQNASPKPDGSGDKPNDMTREQVISQARPSVVQINVQVGQAKSIGSGEILDQQGNIVTNNHVISNGHDFQVELFDGTTLPAKLVGADASDDLAVIKINPPKHLTPIALGDSSQLQVGDAVLAIGNPLGITQTVTSGIVSALGRTVPEGQDQGGATIINAVQTDAAINPGNSGGALVDMQGKLVGIPAVVPLDPEFKVPASGVGFAIPVNRVKFIAPQLIQHGKVVHSGRAAIGATVATVDAQVAAQAGLSVDHGALIVSVTPGGPADQAGLRTDDVITQVNNAAIANATDLTDELLHQDPGSTANVTIMRGSKQMQVKVKLGEMQPQ